MKFLFTIIIFSSMGLFASESYEEQVISSVESLRKISPTEDKKELENYNSIMDNNWSIFAKKKEVSLPILTEILNKEIVSKEPNHLLLLDLGWFIALSDEKAEFNSILFKVYEKIDYRQKIILYNSQQYFRYSLLLSSRQLPGFLNLIDQRFLKNEARSFFIPQHVAMVDAHAQRTHLYGIYGKESIRHLLDILKIEKDVPIRRSVLSILRRICTVECAQDTFELLSYEQDHESFVNGTYILLDNTGPKGRELYLKLNPKNLSEKTRNYFKNEQNYVKNLSFEFLVNKMEKKYGKSGNNFSNEEFIVEIDKMINNMGASRVLHPLDFITSSQDKESLIEKLIESRRNCFHRLNRHGMEDIDISNMIINTLYFKN